MGVVDRETAADSSNKDDSASNSAAAAPEVASLKRPNPGTTETKTSQSANPKPKKRKHMDPVILKLRTEIHQCCKRNDMYTAWQLFQEARNHHVTIEAHVLYNLLSLCDGLGVRQLHVGTPRHAATTAKREPSGIGNPADDNEKPEAIESPTEYEEPANDEEPVVADSSSMIEPVSDAVRCDYAKIILQYMQNERKLALTETAYTALTRLYSRAGDLESAIQCLTKAEQTQQCKVKLRLYSPILMAYCERKDWMGALQIWLRLCQFQLCLTEREYASLLPGPYLERVLADLIEDVIIPSKQTVNVLRQCLLGFSSSGASDDHHHDQQQPEEWQLAPMTDEMKDQLTQIPAPELQTTLNLPQAKNGWIESSSCTIDRSNGILLSGCMKGVALQAVTLNDEYVRNMLQMNERIVLTGRIDSDATPFQGGGKGKKRELNENDLKQRQRQWNNFRDYMAKAKETKQISIVIDGANVGYHEQNFKGSPKHVNYEQIDAVVRKFDPNTVLLVLHTRHCCSPLMPPFAQRYLDRWKNVLYQTPHGMNDDWFWLHAALETNAMVVTNDHMRDHHFQMVTPRSFLRWRDRHQIYFYLKGQNVNLTFPDPYSRRIQLVEDGLIVPLPKKGDESRFLDGCFVAEDAPEEEMYTCFRPRKHGELPV